MLADLHKFRVQKMHYPVRFKDFPIGAFEICLHHFTAQFAYRAAKFPKKVRTHRRHLDCLFMRRIAWRQIEQEVEE